MGFQRRFQNRTARSPNDICFCLIAVEKGVCLGRCNYDGSVYLINDEEHVEQSLIHINDAKEDISRVIS